MNRFTVNAGLRLDYFNSYVPPQNVPASAFVIERNLGLIRFGGRFNYAT